MTQPLRLFPLKDQENTEIQPATVKVELGELLPLIAYADKQDYAFLKDFLDDPIIITLDFYEVLRAFNAERPAA